MEYLQYSDKKIDLLIKVSSFKPYYKWNTFNTARIKKNDGINNLRFKPYYKWNTFNTLKDDLYDRANWMF